MAMIGTLILLCVITLSKSDDVAIRAVANLTKHPISTEDFNSLRFLSTLPPPPVMFSSRVKRQLASGELEYVYDTDTDESSGNWGPWEPAEACSRTCG